MRILLPIAASCLLVACREQEDANVAEPQPQEQSSAKTGLLTFAGRGRDRLCLDPQNKRAGFIAYGAGNSNCSVRGSLEDQNIIRPDGDTACAIPFRREPDGIELLSGEQACGYYCGPGASFESKKFQQAEGQVPVTDLAGDPLC